MVRTPFFEKMIDIALTHQSLIDCCGDIILENNIPINKCISLCNNESVNSFISDYL